MNPTENILNVIKENPGIRKNKLYLQIAYNDELIDDCVLTLKIQNLITSVGSKLYSLEQFPNIAPDTSIILKEIKRHPEGGVSYETLKENINYPREVIKEELDFLKKQKRIYELEGRYYPVPIPEPETSHPLLKSLDFLTREELIALVRLLVQQHQWMDESLKDAGRLVNSRRTPIKGEDEFTGAGGQFAGIKPDGAIHLDFKDFK